VSNLIIKNGHIVDPGQGTDRTGDIFISNGKIAEPFTEGPDTTVIDADGMVVSPGFIDLHCHLRDPGFPEKETIATGTRAAAKGGFTTICCMPNTRPALDSKETIDYVKSTALLQGVVRVLPIGCITKKREGKELADLAEIVEAGAIGFSDDGSPVMNSAIMRQALEFTRECGLPVMEHCEDINLTGKGQMNEGEFAGSLGLAGIPAESEEIIVARDLMLAKLTGGWLHICHVSTAGSVELIKQAKDGGVRVTCEVTPHHLTLTEEMVLGYDANAKVSPPLRTEKDIQALIQGLEEGIIDIIATDHAPHTEKEKMSGFLTAPSGISVFETALGSLMSLVHNYDLDLMQLINFLTAKPAKLLSRYGELGTLAPGAEADITVFDPNAEWVVDTNEFASKGKNTPLKGSTLRGKVITTIYQGKIVYTSCQPSAFNRQPGEK
jgi:dihydroorotase